MMATEAFSTEPYHSVTEEDILGLLDTAPWSLEENRSIRLVNNHGHNLAHLCAQLKYHRLLIAVIERGADIHARDVNGWTPLDFARLHRDEDAIDILEGDWEDYIQNMISTGSSPVDLLRRFVPGCVLAIRTKALAMLMIILEVSHPIFRHVQRIGRQTQESKVLNQQN